MSALNLKLLRDLWGMKGQALAIALVIAGGVATFIMSLSTLESLRLTQAAFYLDYRFADVFASLKRAPENLGERIRDLPGVQQVETRVLAQANLDIEGYPDPVTAMIVSLPDRGRPALNRLFLRRGRTIDPARDNEVMVSESFADAHGFQPGDHVYATINGRRRRLEMVGIALSPEFIYQLAPGAVIPDFKSYGILWMARKPLAYAYDMDGAFNNVTLSLSAEASPEDIVDRLDELLARYGGLGAHGREDQLSHRYLSEEFRGLEQMATLFPAIFLGVAAFLLNVVVSRLIATQREQVAILKAFGYSNLAIMSHYLKLVLAIALLGVAAGVGFGALLGQGLSRMYMDFYHFPFLLYRLRPGVILLAALITAAAAAVGTLYSVIRAAGMPPAVGMQAEPPARYRVSIVERMGLRRWLAQPTRMIVRNIERRPVKALLSTVGIAFACAILITGGFFSDAVDYMVDVQFKLAQRDDITVTFTEPASGHALSSLRSVPGVGLAEGYRSVPARLRYEHRSYRTSLNGLPPDSVLRRLLNRELQPVALPPEGVLLTDHLAGILGIQPGDLLTVEVLEGSRPVRQVPVAGVVNEYVGVSGYMRLPALQRLMREGSAISGAYLAVDPARMEEVYARLKEMPRVAGAAVREKTLRNFYETMARQMLVFAFINTLLAASIAFGVVYNSARIAFAERSREMASLRVLGFTRGEISYILLGELALLTLAAIPGGFLIGRGICAFMIRSMETDLFRIPLVIAPWTYSFAATVILVSALISSLIVRRELDRLDLVAVLKTKE